MRSKLGWFCVCVATSALCFGGELRTWTDKTGKYRVDAELVSLDGGIATLRKTDGKEARVPLEKLSDEDQKFLSDKRLAPAIAADGAPAGRLGEASVELSTYRALELLLRQQRDASFVVRLIEGFLELDGVETAEKDKAREKLEEWRQFAEKQAIRVGNQWMTPEEHKQAKADEIRLIKEAHRLIDIKNDQLAKDKFLEASNVNPEAVRADFYLGLLNALVAHHPPEADDHFKECVNRLKRDDDLLIGVRRANYVAALNNLAIIQVRLGRYKNAIDYWRKSIDVAPFTPELVQNLGLMTALAQSGVVRVPRALRTSAGNLYAKATVDNNLARFDETVGWLFIPYIDTLDGSMDSSGDEEMITVSWCTGFSVGGDYVLTSRYPFVEADQIVLRAGGNAFETPVGKVVAISDDSHLAIVRFDGLNAKPFRLSEQVPSPAQDVTIAGYGQPGFGIGDLQRRDATILAPPRLYQNVDLIVSRRIAPDVTATVYVRGFRCLLMHDAITNAGLEGAPLIDQNGNVVGVHLGNRPQFGQYGSKNSWAESSTYIREKLVEISPEAQARIESAAGASVPDRTEIEKLTNESIYQLVAQRRAPRLAWSHRIEELHRLQQQGSWTSYEDRTCMACNGKERVRCRACSRGVVRNRVRELKYTDPNTGSQIYGDRIQKEECKICNGTGFIDCANCAGN